MKKYGILFSVTVLLLAAIWQIGKVYAREEKVVSVYEVCTVSSDQKIVSSGTVERTSVKSVFPGMGGIVKDLAVQVGSVVKKGQPLLTIQPYEIPTASSLETLEDYYEKYYSSSSILSGLTLQNAKTSDSQTDNDTSSKVLTAPVDGVVLSLAVSENEYVDPSKAVLVIAEEEGFQVRLRVSENHIADLQVGQSAVITGEGFKGSVYTGTVSSIGSEAQKTISPSSPTIQEVTVEVLVQVHEQEGPIKAGFTAQCEIITQTALALVVPYEAVLADDQGNEYVFVIDSQGILHQRFVRSGKEYANGIEILEGVSEGELLAVSSSSLSSGDRVTEGERMVMEDA